MVEKWRAPPCQEVYERDVVKTIRCKTLNLYLKAFFTVQNMDVYKDMTVTDIEEIRCMKGCNSRVTLEATVNRTQNRKKNGSGKSKERTGNLSYKFRRGTVSMEKGVRQGRRRRVISFRFCNLK